MLFFLPICGLSSWPLLISQVSFINKDSQAVKMKSHNFVLLLLSSDCSLFGQGMLTADRQKNNIWPSDFLPIADIIFTSCSLKINLKAPRLFLILYLRHTCEIYTYAQLLLCTYTARFQSIFILFDLQWVYLMLLRMSSVPLILYCISFDVSKQKALIISLLTNGKN